jgi:hypothetical protein
MMSEWMKVMLEEIERKRIDADQALLEQQRREREGGAESGVAESGVAESTARAPQPADRPKG